VVHFVEENTSEGKNQRPRCESCGAKSLKKSVDHGELFSQRRRNTKRQHSFRVEPERYKFQKSDTADDQAENKSPSTQEPELHVVDPVFVNPNSYDSITQVLRHVGRCAGIYKYGSGKRKWTFVTMDGLPFSMAYNVIQATFTCKLCQISIYGEDSKASHCSDVHHGDDSFLDREFDWVVLRIGHGHFEMNMKKAFMELNFEPFMADIAKELGFKSANAQRYVKTCSDNHKTWDLVCIARDAFADELLCPYVQKCLKLHEPCTVNGYFGFAMDGIQNPNYKFIYEQIFVYLQAIVNFRVGLRENKHHLVTAGKEKFSPLWFSRNHPKYQQIHVCDTHDRYCYGDDVKRLVTANESFSVTGNPDSGEGLDFVLENVNKKVKAILANGVPNADDWMLAFRNYHELEKIRASTLSRMGVSDPNSSGTSSRHRGYDEEIRKCRCLIRKSKILSDPHSSCALQSLSGKLLKDNLLDITTTGQKNKQAYTNSLKKGKCKPSNLLYVIVTDDEIAVQSRTVTKASLAASIQEKLLRLPHGNIADYFSEQWNEVKKGKKEGYIEFFKLLDESEIDQRTDDGEYDPEQTEHH
jgi:hypothetical protein